MVINDWCITLAYQNRLRLSNLMPFLIIPSFHHCVQFGFEPTLSPCEINQDLLVGVPCCFSLSTHVFFFFFFFFYSVLRPFQDYFSSYETGQSVGGAKTGEPREKPPDTPTSRTWLVSHVARAGLEPTPVTAVR